MSLSVCLLLSCSCFRSCYRYYISASALSESQVVEKLDLYGLDFMWQIALETPSEEIADQAMKHLMKMCFTNLSQKLKKVSRSQIHSVVEAVKFSSSLGGNGS